MEYAASVTVTPEYFLQRLQGIQYKAQRIIFKGKSGCSSKILHVKANIPTIKERIITRQNYFFKALATKKLNDRCLNLFLGCWCQVIHDLRKLTVYFIIF